MDQTTLLYVMTAFVIISAVALLIQAGMLFGMYRTTRSLQQSIQPLIPKVESLVDNATTTIQQSRQQIAEITERTNEILDSTKRQLAMVEEVVTDATSRAKVQLERVEMVLDDTVSRAHETIATLHGGVMRPLREITGIAAGLRTALNFLARGSRPSVDRVTTDEEMFI